MAEKRQEGDKGICSSVVFVDIWGKDYISDFLLVFFGKVCVCGLLAQYVI